MIMQLIVMHIVALGIFADIRYMRELMERRTCFGASCWKMNENVYLHQTGDEQVGRRFLVLYISICSKYCSCTSFTLRCLLLEAKR